MSRIVAFGDLHGEYTKLIDIVAKVEARDDIDPKRDTFVFLGDFVDGGLRSYEVVEWLMKREKEYPTVCLLGNHEDLMLNALKRSPTLCTKIGVPVWNFDLWWGQGGRETGESYKKALLEGRFEISNFSIDLTGMNEYQYALMNPEVYVSPAHTNWMQGLPLDYETDHFIFVHAGLRPQKSVGDTSAADKLWIRDEFIYSSYDWGKRVIYGHTYEKKGPRVRTEKIGIDTMTHGGGVITAVVLDESRPDWFEFEKSFFTERT